MTLVWSALLATALAASAPAHAQEDRPSEEQLFGAPAQQQPPSAPDAGKPQRPAPGEAPAAKPGQEPPANVPPAQGGGPRPSEAELFGGTGSPNAAPAPEIIREREDPLKIGGMLYLRANSTWQRGVAPARWYFTSPNLVDTYLDVRPNDRVRGFILGRLSFDPTLDPNAANGPLAFPGQRVPPNPGAVLDQLWINFDLERTVFVTAGRQHVKWGVGRFWNPTDYLHPVKRDPLAVFDPRTGLTMVKLHLPWERRGWNLYGVVVLEDIAGRSPTTVNALGQTVPDSTNRLGRLGGGGRAEVVLGEAEIGLDALAQDGHKPRFGVDVSTGLLDFDVYAEAALRSGTDIPVWAAVPGVPPTAPLNERFVRADPTGFTPQLTVGGTWSAKYSDEDAVTLGAEYFFNDAGYSSPSIYPFLLTVSALGGSQFTPGSVQAPNPFFAQPSAFTPFYLGRHYAGAFVLLPNPGSWNNTTFTLSVLGNLSDRSYVARLDHSVLVLTYLRVETYVAGHFGTNGGEFRLGIDAPAQTVSVSPGQVVPIPAIHYPPPVLDLGVAIRVSL